MTTTAKAHSPGLVPHQASNGKTARAPITRAYGGGSRQSCTSASPVEHQNTSWVIPLNLNQSLGNKVWAGLLLAPCCYVVHMGWPINSTILCLLLVPATPLGSLPEDCFRVTLTSHHKCINVPKVIYSFGRRTFTYICQPRVVPLTPNKHIHVPSIISHIPYTPSCEASQQPYFINEKTETQKTE